MSNDFADLPPPSIEAQVNRSSATLGDIVTLSLRVTHPQALGVDTPSFPKTLGTFEVYASTRLPAEVNGADAIDHFQLALQNFATGPQLLAGLEIPYRDPMGKAHTLKAPEVTVTFQPVPPGPKDKGDIRGFKGVIGPTAWSPWWWALLGALVAAALVFAWMKRKKRIQGPPPPPPVPADIVAMQKLEKLAQTDWIVTGKIKDYYSALSDILREYLEKGFKTMALERTTGELMRDLRKNPDFPGDRQTELRDILDLCDLVKFAKFRPDADEAQAMHAASTRFVEHTRAVLRKDDENFEPQNELR